VGRLRIHGNTSNVWGNFPKMGRLPTYGKTSQICEGVGPNYGGVYPGWPSAPPCVPPVGHFAWPGSTPPKSLNDMLLITEHICYHTGFSFHIWEDFPYMGRLPIHGNTSHTCDVLYIGRLPIDGKSSHRWEVFA
jgi:hypothetical protein